MITDRRVESFKDSRGIHFHPSRLCNLSCLHCYSSSSPKERDALDVALLCNALSDAVDEGYNYVSISGGEPLLYRPLEALLKHAKSLHYITAITTNGMLLDEQCLNMLEGKADLIAVSLDGFLESHKRIRGSDLAFDKMSMRLEHLRNSCIPFGFIFTLTQYNLNELEWVVDFALEQGARQLQIHPLENSGFASNNLPDEIPDRTESAYAYLLSSNLQQQLKGKMVIKIDFANRQTIQQHPDQFYVVETLPKPNSPMAECVESLAIEPDGTIVPMQHGFSRHYALGDLHKADFKQLADNWKQHKMADFYRLCEKVYTHCIDQTKPLTFNWNEIITAASHDPRKITF